MLENNNVNQTEQEVVQFLDTNLGTVKEFGPKMDLADYYGKMKKADLADFLSRPVLINSTSWTGATTQSTVTTIYPWKEFFNNTFIKYKLNNYSFLRCKLKVKILINASPFFYGAMLVSYSPLEYYNNLITYSGASLQSQIMQKSQLPHLWLFPQNNQGGELTLPFVYHQDWISINGSSGLDNLTRMGTLRYDVVQVLKSANGALTGSDVINIQTYAWAEEVDVSGPTIGLALQGGDWEANGVISKPASYISSIASGFECIPVIGHFARAISIGSGAVSKIASLFGFTNIPNIKDVNATMIKNVPDLSTTEISYPINRLALDPKNELSIDPGIVGGDRYDQMSIRYLTAHESLIGYGSWNVMDAVDTPLFMSVVTPMLQLHGNHSVAGEYIMQTPMCHVGHLFKYWRGDIIFKFVIVSSKFHKGRLRFTFDPTGNSTTNIFNTANNSTVTYTQIIDLSDQTEFEIRIPYHQALPFLECGDNDWTPYLFNGTKTFDTGNEIYFNGNITLRVLTGLTAPADTADCSFLVFARGADNLEFAFPNSSYRTEVGASLESYWEPQSSEYKLESTLDNEKSDRISNSDGTLEFNNQSCEIPVTMSGNKSGGDLPKRYNVNFGERILSLRQLFHRSNLYRVLARKYAANDFIGTLIMDKHPVLPGYNSYGLQKFRNTANTADVAAVISEFTPMAYMAPCFLGYRGSINHIAIPIRNSSSGDIHENLSIMNISSTGYNQETYLETTYANSIPLNEYVFDHTLRCMESRSGAAITNTAVSYSNPINLPMYTNYKFKYTHPSQRLNYNSVDGNSEDLVAYTMRSTAASAYMIYASAGFDYSLNFFRCCPMLYRYSTPLVSTT